MKAILKEGKIIQGIPQIWNRKDTPNRETHGYHKLADSEHYKDGWRDLIEPSFDSTTQYLGLLYFDVDNDIFTWEVLDYTSEELAANNTLQIEIAPLLIEVYAKEIGAVYPRAVDIPIDLLEIFEPREKVYHLLGYPLFKEYYKDDVLVCRLEYERMFADLTHKGITKNEFIGTCTRFVFFKDVDGEHFETKEKVTKRFDLKPTEITDDNDLLIDVIWSSADREQVKRTQRYKSEQVMKSFNPDLYYLFIGLFGEKYSLYKETGIKDELIQDVQKYQLAKLDEQVMDEDKAVVFGPMETYPSLTIRQLIIQALV